MGNKERWTMKKIMISVIMLTMLSAFSFADEGEQESPPPAQIQEKAQTEASEPAQKEETAKKVIKEVTLRTGTSDSVTGKVASIDPADPLTKPRSNIVIVDAAGEAVDFVVKTLAVIYDSTGRFLSLDDVKPEQEVQVDYIKKPGKVKEAAAIKILK
jgi:hypothetical protein